MADTIHYTKVETDAKIGDVKKFAVSGIAGDLDKVLASDIPSTGYYKYDVFKAKTYTNVTPNITVTPQDLENKIVYVVVKNGVAEKEFATSISPVQDIQGGSLSFNKAGIILGDYINIKNENITYLPLQYYALTKENTRVPDNPFSCSVMDINVVGFDTLRFFACKSGANTSTYCSVLGIKADNSKVVLLEAIGQATTTPTDVNIELQGCVTVSISWQNISSVTPIFTKLKSGSKNSVDVDITEIQNKIKDYIPDSKVISTDGFQEGVLRNDNTFISDSVAKTLMNIETEGYSQLSFNGYPSTVGIPNVNSFATIIGIKSSGEVNVLEKSVPTTNTTVINKKYDVSSYIKVSISWGNYGASAGSTPILGLGVKPEFKETNVRSIDLMTNTYRQLETLTNNITLSVTSPGSFGNINVFQFTGGGVLFSGDVVMDENSDVYDPTKVNTIYTYSEYGVVRCLIEN
ncbi:hypothetical protein M2T79_09475 [Elizabethkingia miricola]|uniref:hypothetical protein n=1 Tax=Elizabethkingia miricola TaxID=172045 RepID=UPI0020198835|nr:hypothetical protein [Elizabethkingia miricola]MCL1656827.1 hypothetical protein [Elizabethkingia miricola]